MPTLRWYASGGADPPASAKVRWYASSGTGTESTPKVRWYASSGAGSEPVAPSLRWYASSGTGSSAPSILDLPNLGSAEPSTTITFTAVTAAGSSVPDTYVWSVAWVDIAAPLPTLTTVGNTATLKVPSVANSGGAPVGGTLAVTCRPYKDAVAGATKTGYVTALPQLWWTRVPGGQWVGAT